MGRDKVQTRLRTGKPVPDIPLCLQLISMPSLSFVRFFLVFEVKDRISKTTNHQTLEIPGVSQTRALPCSAAESKLSFSISKLGASSLEPYFWGPEPKATATYTHLASERGNSPDDHFAGLCLF